MRVASADRVPGVRLAVLYALAYPSAAHAQKIPLVAVAVLAALLVTPLIAVALKWVTLRVLRAPAPARGLWITFAADCGMWLVALPVAWSLWDRDGLPAAIVALLALSVWLHHRVVRPREPAAARGASGAAWARSALLASETPALGLLLATLTWLAFFF